MNMEKTIKVFIGQVLVNFLQDNSNKPFKEKLITASINSIPDVINTIEFKNEIKQQTIQEKNNMIVVAEFIDSNKNNW